MTDNIESRLSRTENDVAVLNTNYEHLSREIVKIRDKLEDIDDRLRNGLVSRVEKHEEMFTAVKRLMIGVLISVIGPAIGAFIYAYFQILSQMEKILKIIGK